MIITQNVHQQTIHQFKLIVVLSTFIPVLFALANFDVGSAEVQALSANKFNVDDLMYIP